MHRVVLSACARATGSVARLSAMSQLRKRKSLASTDLDALTQGDPGSASQGPATPAQVEAEPASLRRSRRAAVSAALRLAELADQPLTDAAARADAAADLDATAVAKPARRGRKQREGITEGTPEGSLEPAASVVVTSAVRRARKKPARSGSEVALAVEPDSITEPETAVVIRRSKGKKAAVAAAAGATNDTSAAAVGDAAAAKPPRAPRRRKVVVAPAPLDAALVDAPPLPALTVERMPAAIAHLAAADPGATLSHASLQKAGAKLQSPLPLCTEVCLPPQ